MVPLNPSPQPPSSECSSSYSLFASMSANSVSKTETTSPPQPKQPSMIFSANEVSHLPSFRQPSPDHQTLGGSRSAPRAAATLPRMPVFSLSLTKAEIEEDFLKMTGELPPKKPLRRAKNVQKQMDVIFPGTSLDNVTPETYKVPDPPLKR